LSYVFKFVKSILTSLLIYSPSKRRRTSQETNKPTKAAKKAAAASRKARLSQEFDQLEKMLDCTDFYVSVAAEKPKEVLGTLGTLQFTLAENETWLNLKEAAEANERKGLDELWIYLSAVPNASFVYRQWFVHDTMSETTR